MRRRLNMDLIENLLTRFDQNRLMQNLAKIDPNRQIINNIDKEIRNAKTVKTEPFIKPTTYKPFGTEKPQNLDKVQQNDKILKSSLENFLRTFKEYPTVDGLIHAEREISSFNGPTTQELRDVMKYVSRLVSSVIFYNKWQNLKMIRKATNVVSIIEETNFNYYLSSKNYEKAQRNINTMLDFIGKLKNNYYMTIYPMQEQIWRSRQGLVLMYRGNHTEAHKYFKDLLSSKELANREPLVRLMCYNLSASKNNVELLNLLHEPQHSERPSERVIILDALGRICTTKYLEEIKSSLDNGSKNSS